MMFPEVIRLESSAVCNLRCIHCVYAQGYKKNRGILNDDIVDILISQMKERIYIPRVVVLYHGGEPLLNPHLPNYIQRFKEYGVRRIKIVTNAVLMDDAISTEIINAGLTDIDFSFDGKTPIENDLIRINCVFDLVRENVKRFIKKCDKKEITIRICNTQVLEKDDSLNEQPPKNLNVPAY